VVPLILRTGASIEKGGGSGSGTGAQGGAHGSQGEQTTTGVSGAHGAVGAHSTTDGAPAVGAGEGAGAPTLPCPFAEVILRKKTAPISAVEQKKLRTI